MRCDIPDDNSCLFRAVLMALCGKNDHMCVVKLRSIVRDAILADTLTYSAVVLEKSPEEYAQWVMKDTSWGGAIELSILTAHFKVCLACVDVRTAKLRCFGEGYSTMAFLLYTGIHYDLLASPPYTLFPRDDEVILALALDVAMALQSEGKFTSTATYKLRCGVCGAVVTGDAEAVKHATSTGHTDFAEHKK
jgi:ubiquitin thioesterase OTU1